MNTWLANNWAGLLTIVGIIFTVWGARQWGTRTRKLQVLQDATRLLVGGDLQEELVVTYKGVPVVDPHLVTLRLRNIGPRDITRAENFDGEKPLLFALHGDFYGLVEVGSNDGTEPTFFTAADSSSNGYGDVLGFRPAHIPKGTQWVVKFIASGPSYLERRGPLVETKIIDGETTSRAFARLLMVIWGGLIPGLPPITRDMFSLASSENRPPK